MKPVLVLGVGNILMGDDASGIRVVESLKDAAIPDDVELVLGECGGLDLVDEIANRDRVIVVDAMDFNAAPGTVCQMNGLDLDEPSERILSPHEFGLVSAFKMARQLECSPRQITVFGIQPVPSNMEFGLGMSPEVVAAIPKVAALVLREIAAPAG